MTAHTDLDADAMSESFIFISTHTLREGKDAAHRRLRKAQRHRPGDDQAAGGVGGPAQPQDPPPRRLHPLHRWL